MSNFQSLNMAEMMEENERLETPSGGGDFLENFVRMPEKDGFVTVRLLPPKAGSKFFCATRTHRINNKSIHCPRVLVNRNGVKRWEDPDPKQPCVICKYYSELWKESERKEGQEQKELQNQARAIKPIERYYYNSIVRSQLNTKTNEMEKNVGPKILSIGKTLHQRIVKGIVGDPSTEEKPLGDVTDVKTGRDFKIVKKMKGSGSAAYPEYPDSKFLDSSPLGDKDQVEKWLNNLHDLSSLRVLRPNDEMKVELKKHLGLIKDETTDFDISEFQKSSASLEEQVQAAVKEEPKTKEKPKSNPNTVEDEVLAEEDFLEELRNV
jgi:hypothetical protein